jgi:hypothetical protein
MLKSKNFKKKRSTEENVNNPFEDPEYVNHVINFFRDIGGIRNVILQAPEPEIEEKVKKSRKRRSVEKQVIDITKKDNKVISLLREVNKLKVETEYNKVQEIENINFEFKPKLLPIGSDTIKSIGVLYKNTNNEFILTIFDHHLLKKLSEVKINSYIPNLQSLKDVRLSDDGEMITFVSQAAARNSIGYVQVNPNNGAIIGYKDYKVIIQSHKEISINFSKDKVLIQKNDNNLYFGNLDNPKQINLIGIDTSKIDSIHLLDVSSPDNRSIGLISCNNKIYIVGFNNALNRVIGKPILLGESNFDLIHNSVFLGDYNIKRVSVCVKDQSNNVKRFNFVPKFSNDQFNIQNLQEECLVNCDQSTSTTVITTKGISTQSTVSPTEFISSTANTKFETTTATQIPGSQSSTITTVSTQSTVSSTEFISSTANTKFETTTATQIPSSQSSTISKSSMSTNTSNITTINPLPQVSGSILLIALPVGIIMLALLFFIGVGRLIQRRKNINSTVAPAEDFEIESISQDESSQRNSYGGVNSSQV